MASPVNIGDAIAILTSIYKTYDAYRSTPDMLRQALRRFVDAEKECKALNKVLATSRRSEYRTWPDTARLIADLEEAHKFFQQFEPLSDEAGNVTMIAKVRKTFRVKWSWSEVENHVATVNRHRENIKDFKQTVLIQAAQDNIELQLHALQMHLGHRQGTPQVAQRAIQDDVSSLSSDRLSVLSKVSRSLSVARQLQIEPPRRHEVRLSPIIEASSSFPKNSQTDGPDDLKRKFADFIEKVELHKADSVQAARLQDLEYIAELPKHWYRSQQKQQQELQQQLSGWPSQRSTHGGAPMLPQIPARSDDAVSVSPSWYSALDKAQYGNNAAVSPMLSGSKLPGPALDIDTVTTVDGASVYSVQNDEEEQAIEGVMIMIPFIALPMPCRLKLVQSEGSLCIQSTTIKGFHRQALSALGGLTPSSLLHIGGRNDDEVCTSGTTPLVFNHAVLAGMSSFPRILHPGAETSMNGSNGHPYLIEFYDHQYCQAEGYPKLPKAVKGLSYAFRHKTDRNLVRQKIFGKKLLASVGISTIQFDTSSVPKPCGTQAASLWKNTPISIESSNVSDRAGGLTITIQCSTSGKQTEPDCAVEFHILKIDHKNIEKVKNDGDKKLKLELRRVESDNHDPLTVIASGGILSSSSTTSGLSKISGSSNSTAEKPSSPKSPLRGMSFFSSSQKSSVMSVATKPLTSFQCWIRFTEGTNGLTRAKQDLLDALKANFKA